jgi:hypothetical protein
MSTRFATQWFGGIALLLAGAAARAFTLPSSGCVWESGQPTAFTATRLVLVALIVLLIVPSSALPVATEPRRPVLHWIFGAVLLVEFATAIWLSIYLGEMPAHPGCG